MEGELQKIIIEDGPADQDISINYASYRNAYVRRYDAPTLQPIVIFGDFNFTFSIALAALRGGWDGIISATQDHTSPFSELQLQNIEYAIENHKHRDCDKLSKVLGLKQPPRGAWKCNIDPLDNELEVRGKVVWLQCPQNSGRFHIDLKEFVQHMASKQSKGDYLLIGIANYFKYLTHQNLGDLLQVKGHYLIDRDDTMYDFLGFDDKLIGEILTCGYKPHGIDHSDDIRSKHMTLIFRRNCTK